MTETLFWIFIGLLILPFWRVMHRPERIYEFPYFMATAFGAFMVPQAVSLCRFPGAASEAAVARVLAMACLCLGTCLVAYEVYARPRRASCEQHVRRGNFLESRLLQAGLAFAGSGLFFGYVLGRMEVETSETGGWTGTATIYGFFHQLCYPGLALCLMVALRRPNLVSVVAALLAAIVPVQSVLFGRREPAALLAITVGLTLFFQFRTRPPRWLVLAVISAAMLVIPSTGTYRGYHLQNDWESIRQIQVVANFKEFLEQETILELRNAAMLIEATRRSGDYQYGAGYWNHLVFRYVPAQWLGSSWKESLMIRTGDGVERELAAMDYTNPAGSTVTGLGDSFQQFGYFGCAFFGMMALVFQRLWARANEPNAIFSQLLYMQSCTCALRALTHWTLDFFPGLLYNLLFLGLAGLYARRPARADKGVAARLPNRAGGSRQVRTAQAPL